MGCLGLTMQDNLYFACYGHHFIIPTNPGLYQAIPNETYASCWAELEVTHKDLKKFMTPPSLCKLSFGINSSTPSQVTALPNSGTQMKDTTKAPSRILSSTFLINTLSSPTSWLKATKYSLINQWTSKNHQPSTSKSKRTVNLSGQFTSPQPPHAIIHKGTKQAVATGLFNQAYKILKHSPMENTFGPTWKHAGPDNSLILAKCNVQIALYIPNLVSMQQQQNIRSHTMS